MCRCKIIARIAIRTLNCSEHFTSRSLPFYVIRNRSSCVSSFYYGNIQKTVNSKIISLDPFTNHIRYFAKGRDKPKSSKGNVVQFSDSELSDYINVSKFRQELEEAVKILKNEYIQQVSLRSASGSVESLPVEFEGQSYTIQDLAQISRKNPKVIVLNLTLFPQTVLAVIDAINKSGMNLNPQQDGTTIYVEIPKVTKEHRENLAKNAAALFVKCKNKINDIMSFYIKKLDSKQLSMEQQKFIQMQITAIAKNYTAEAEKMKNNKQAELRKEN